MESKHKAGIWVQGFGQSKAERILRCPIMYTVYSSLELQDFVAKEMTSLIQVGS